jgi:malate dehydrogenase (oxaloacetate-decarboxylating)
MPGHHEVPESVRHGGRDPLFALHRGGKMQITPTAPVRDDKDLALAYTPGVARVAQAIARQPDLAADYTRTSYLVAVVTDGTAVLGRGDLGP